MAGARLLYMGLGPANLGMGTMASYFAPYPMYPTASLWLTDFLLAETLKLAYQTNVATEQDKPTLAADPAYGGRQQLRHATYLLR